MMLRVAAARLARLQTPSSCRMTSISTRNAATSAQKRALTKEQVSGSTKPSSKAPSDAVKTPGGDSTGGASDGGGGGSSGSSWMALVGVAAVGGGAYYMDLIPGMSKEKESTPKVVEKPPKVAEKEVKKAAAPASAPVVKKVEEKKKEEVVPKKVEKKVEPVVTNEKAPEKKKAPAKTKPEPNRVLNVQVPPKNDRVSEPLPPSEHAADGNRVSVEAFKKVYLKDTVVLNQATETPTTPVPTKASPTAAMVNEAMDELKPKKLSAVDERMAKEQAMIRVTADETYLKDLDALNESQLRVRVVQLVSEISDRTKWEAVRLKEFLTMKEKEVGEQYMETMQKQRLQFEELLARRMREQEYELVTKANADLKAKEESIQQVINAVTETKDAEQEAALKMATESLEQELSAKYEKQLGDRMATAKEAFTKELESHLATLESLSERLRQNEQNLEISRNFESGSQRAHRVSAAALALAEKMETSKGATEELFSLKAAAVENGVIASALSSIPDSVKSGVSTLPELQAKFDDVLKVGRQAAYVPVGRSGLGGQFAGMVFAAMTVPPSPDSLPPSDVTLSESKLSDYILAQAKRHVQLGELQEAVDELDKLKGQTAFVLSDWKQTAKDRIAVEKALKVIKMECALMNKNMGGA